MIDKEQSLDVCKIATIKHVKHKIERDKVSNDKALKAIAKEADIPYSTIKKWFYDGLKEKGKSTTPKTNVTPGPILDQTPLKIEEGSPKEVPASTKKVRRPLRLLPELDEKIIRYKDEHGLTHADTFIQLLERGLKKQDVIIDPVLEKILKQISKKELQGVVSKAAIIAKEVGAGQSAAEILNLGLDVFYKK